MLKRYRKENNLRQEDLARKLFVTPQAISKWEKGQSIPGKESFQELSVMLGVTEEYLLDQKTIVYKVKHGDNLFRIAVNNGITTDELKRLNNKKGNEISVGEELYLQ
ncbi:helix-turn-helix domain-containing protein [uncultured Vagococcus sp.]|uniref:helix-turn-helix domain-containing protein n=1 Tax=uncultured Vagococcus sp. TaxID=189676 RepID=UPI0028D358ED|nr:helix-turn-helix domain-containing protein [uncultured Vagococcus sp.]